jgi:1-deoxy-D-xylulose-5-phosphate reductoisomerase
MRIPIAYALAWPERMASGAQRLDLAQVGRFDFEDPDPERFPALRLARQALAEGGSAPARLNAANEAAVSAFLAGRIAFTDIAALVEDALSSAPAPIEISIDGLVALDRLTRRSVQSRIEERCS